MGLKEFFTQKRFMVTVLQGQVGSKKEPYLLIWKEKEPCTVTVNKRKYFFLGLSERTYEEVSNARTLSGAAVGALFSPVGALIGGAIGAKKKTKSVYTLGFLEKETNETYTIEAEIKAIELDKIKHFDVYEPPVVEKIDENTQSNVADLREFKKLLDEGIITQEEFDKKKQQILA